MMRPCERPLQREQIPSTDNFYMQQTLKYSQILASLCLWLILLAAPNATHAASSDRSISHGPIVVTIKPLYSLVAQLTKGIEEPVLLMQQMPSPHHYTMRPSERRLLSNARVIVWIGPQMETSLGKIIDKQDAVIITAMQAEGITHLVRRAKHGHQHSPDETHDGETQSDEANIDPHIWLSAGNAIAISRHISQLLIAHDPENTARYRTNLQQLSDRITKMAAKIKAELYDNERPFITYHDAYQYFEDEYRLNHIESISFDEEAGISLKHLQHIKASIEQNAIHCLMYQPPKPDIVDTLTMQTRITAYALDPLGLALQDDKEAWFQIMSDAAASFAECLGN